MRVISLRLGAVVLAAGVAAMLACGDPGTAGGANCLSADGGESGPDGGTQQLADAGLPPQDAGEDAGVTPGPDGGQPAVIPALCTNPQAGPPTLTDRDILQILITINQGEVNQGNLAAQSATDPDTKAFAADMVTEHSLALQRLNAIAGQQAITPTDNPASAQFEAKTAQNTSVFTPQSGDSFDLGYMEAQISGHANAMFLADMMMVPQVKNTDLLNELKAERVMFQNHLERAVPIESALFSKP